MKIRIAPVVGLVTLALAAGGSGCSLVLGLGDFTEGGRGGGSAGATGAGGGTACKPLDAVPCYEGAAATEGHGACAAGTKTCVVDGSHYGECIGQTIPTANDDCSKMVDTTCDDKLDCMCASGSTTPCYDGAPGTQGKGTCIGGLRKCDDNGTGYGACLGQVKPAGVDDCGTQKDENCDGVVNDLCTCTPGLTQPCYSGKAGTQGVGECLGGTETCNLDGTKWSECAGEVIPQTENCQTRGDEDCDGTACADVLASHVLPTPSPSAYSFTRVISQTLDAQNSLYILGILVGSIDFGNGVTLAQQQGNSGDALFIAKIDAAGQAQWAKSFAPTKGIGSGAGAICVNSYGNILIGATFSGSVDFGGGALVAGGIYDGVAVSFNSAGQYVWQQHFNTTDVAEINSVACDDAGRLFVLGSFFTSISLGATAPTMIPTGGPHIFVARLDGANIGTMTTYGDAPGQASSGGQRPKSLVMDKSDNLYITGDFDGSIQMGTTALDVGSGDIFLAKLNFSMVPLWLKTFGTPQSETGLSVTVDAAGSVVMSAEGTGSINFGGKNLVGPDRDPMLAKFDVSGQHLWSKRFLSPGSSYGTSSLAVASNDDIVYASFLGAGIDLGNGPLANAGMNDVFIGKFDPNGTPLWSKMLGDAADQTWPLVSVETGTDDVILSLSSSGSVDFGDGPVSSNSSMQSVMLAKFQP